MFSIFNLAFGGAFLFLVSLIGVHFLKNDLHFSHNALSKYAFGRYGWVTSLGLYSIGTSQILLSLGLAQVYSFSIGNLLLIGAGMGALGSALFKMELPIKTIYGLLHRWAAALQFVCFPVALLFLSQHFLEMELRVFTLGICCLTFILLLYLYNAFRNENAHTLSHYGTVQKTNIIVMTSWVMVVSLALG